MKLTNLKQSLSVEVPHYGQVGAGKVVDFLPRGKRKIFWTGDSKEIKLKGIALMDVNGDSLIDVGINNGDELTIQTQFSQGEIKNGKLVVALLPCTGLVVKFFYGFENKIMLRSANVKYEDMVYDAELMTVKAIVLKSIKDWS